MLLYSINKDVPRTDRFQTLFEDEDGPGLKAVHDILMTYVAYNFDLGMTSYVTSYETM
jgi:hypothetical protein